MNILNSQKTVRKINTERHEYLLKLYWTKLMEKLKEVIGSGGADHCDRIDFKLYDRTGAAGHSDGFYYWSNPSDSRNDVLYTGGRDVDDTDGREDRNPDRTVKKVSR